MAGAEKVTTITPLVLELSPEDVGLLNRIVAARSAELDDEGLSASASTIVRSWIRREARRRGLIPPLAGEGLPANHARLEGLDDDASVPGGPVSATLPAVLVPPAQLGRSIAQADPATPSERPDENPLEAHPSLAPLPEHRIEAPPKTQLDFPADSDHDRS